MGCICLICFEQVSSNFAARHFFYSMRDTFLLGACTCNYYQNKKMNYQFFAIFLLALFSKSIATAQEKVVFTPQWIPQAQFAGYYAAQELGYYKELGLDVEIKHPTVSMNVVDMLKNGETDIITSMVTIALLNYNRGVDIRNIMQLMPSSQLVIVGNNPLHGSLENLEGERVALWKSDHSAFAFALLKKRNVKVDWIYHLSGANVFLANCVDAMIAMEYNELQTIKECGRTVDTSQIIYLRDIENIPEDGLYTSLNYAERFPDRVAKFVQASIKGWQWVTANREQAVALVMKVAHEHNTKTNIYHQTAMLNVILDNGVGDSNNTFKLSEEDFLNLRNLLLETGMITEEVSYKDFILTISNFQQK